MPRYDYRASDARCVTLPGQIEAESLSDAIAQLESQGLTVDSINLSPVQPGGPSVERSESQQQSKFRERADAAMQRTVGWLPALEALAVEWPQRGVAKRMHSLAARLKKPFTLEDALSRRETASLLPALLREPASSAGQQAVEDWAIAIASAAEVAERRRLAIAYPATILLVALAVLIFMATLVVPIFKAMFDEFGLPLPPPTQAVFWLSERLGAGAIPTLISLLVVAAMVIPLVIVWRRHALTNLLLGQFVSGTAGNLRAMSIFTGNLAEFLRLGAPLDEAFELAGYGCGHAYYQRHASEISRAMANGVFSLGRVEAARIFPPLLWQALQVGPERAPNTALLRMLSKSYHRRSLMRTDWFVTAAPALTIMLVGLIVAWVVVALFMPMVSMITSLA